MKKRKVQKTGKSSYVITLPKSWIRAHNIQKKQELGFITQQDGSLVITPDLNRTKQERIKEIKISEDTDIDFFIRKLYGAYLSGFSGIRINIQNPLNPQLRQKIIEFTKSLTGPEITQETESYIFIQNLVHPTEMSFKNIITTMMASARSMHRDIIEALLSKNPDIIEHIIQRDEEINKKNYHITRLMSLMMQDLTLPQQIGLSLPSIQCYFVISMYVELIGDTAVQIAQDIRKLIEQDPSKQIMEKMKDLGEKSIEMLNICLDALIQQDVTKANKALELNNILDNQCTQYRKLKFNSEFKDIVVLIIENMRRTGKISANIAFILIDADVDEISLKQD